MSRIEEEGDETAPPVLIPTTLPAPFAALALSRERVLNASVPVLIDWFFTLHPDPPREKITSIFAYVSRALTDIVPDGDVHLEHNREQGWSIASCHDEKTGGWTDWIDGPTQVAAVLRAYFITAFSLHDPDEDGGADTDVYRPERKLFLTELLTSYAASYNLVLDDLDAVLRKSYETSPEIRTAVDGFLQAIREQVQAAEYE